jgi:hypothetical protein
VVNGLVDDHGRVLAGHPLDAVAVVVVDVGDTDEVAVAGVVVVENAVPSGVEVDDGPVL